MPTLEQQKKDLKEKLTCMPQGTKDGLNELSQNWQKEENDKKLSEF